MPYSVARHCYPPSAYQAWRIGDSHSDRTIARKHTAAKTPFASPAITPTATGGRENRLAIQHRPIKIDGMTKADSTRPMGTGFTVGDNAKPTSVSKGSKGINGTKRSIAASADGSKMTTAATDTM